MAHVDDVSIGGTYRELNILVNYITCAETYLHKVFMLFTLKKSFSGPQVISCEFCIYTRVYKVQASSLVVSMITEASKVNCVSISGFSRWRISSLESI